MMSDKLNLLHLFGFIMLALYLLCVGIWLRIRYLKERNRSLTNEVALQSLTTSRLKKICDQYRFEVEWLQATAQGSNSGKHFLEILKNWSSQPKTFYGWIVYDNDDWDGTNREYFPKKLLQKFSYLETQLSFQRENFAEEFSELPDEIETLTLFRTHQPGAESCVIAISETPGCFQTQTDFQQLSEFMKLVKCKSRYVPTKLIEFEDDLESLIAKEMLEIRSLLDDEFQSPVELMRGFLQKLTALSGYTYASLYLQDEEATEAGLYSHFASGGGLLSENGQPSESMVQSWRDGERLFIQTVADHLDESLILTYETILAQDAEIPFRCGMMIPVLQSGELVGVLILTHTADTIPSNEDAQLVEWASQFLMKTLNREFSRIESIDEARRDALTNLANRRTFDLELQRYAERTQTSSECCSLIMLDIDRFKAINDQHGHPAGDEVLREVAIVLQSLTRNLRVTDHGLAARYGGEEFALILPNVGLDGGLRIAEQLRQAIEQSEIVCESQTLSVTASLGVATTGKHGTTSKELIHFADKAMYAAKKSGRNGVCTTDQPLLQDHRNSVKTMS